MCLCVDFSLKPHVLTLAHAAGDARPGSYPQIINCSLGRALVIWFWPLLSAIQALSFRRRAGALGEAAEHLEKAAEEDLDNYMQNVAPDGVVEHTAMKAKIRDETKAAEGNLPTHAAATGKLAVMQHKGVQALGRFPSTCFVRTGCSQDER